MYGAMNLTGVLLFAWFVHAWVNAAAVSNRVPDIADLLTPMNLLVAGEIVVIPLAAFAVVQSIARGLSKGHSARKRHDRSSDARRTAG